jgi:hypothetical protein
MKSANFVVFQKPNKPLLIAIVIWLSAKISQGTVREYLSILFIGVMLWWSYLEISSGVNFFRRLLGVVVGLMMLSSAYKIFIRA